MHEAAAGTTNSSASPHRVGSTQAVSAFSKMAVPFARRHGGRHEPTIARFLLHAPVQPLVEDTLPLAEEFRHRLLCEFKYVSGGLFSETLAGKNDAREPLRNHEHAFYLPADEDGDGRIDHVTVFAERGFGAEEVRALDRLRQLRFGEGDPLRLMLVGLGSRADFRSPLFAPARTWVSATPFLASRYPKLRGTKRDRPEDHVTPQIFAMHVLRQELDRLRERRGDLPAAVGIDPLNVLGRRNLRCIQFRRFRKKQGDDGGRRPSGAFRITFAAPVQGPLCLGHSCHFGLGLFLPGE
jgi:CRISPR-associated protein Csb2